MALPNLTDQNIQDTYQRVIQTDGKQIFDGTGSLLPFEIDGNNFIVSGAVHATEYVVTSSVTNVVFQQQSGSTIFGDSSDDTHLFTGSLFISGGGIDLNPSIPSNGFKINGNTVLSKASDTSSHIILGNPSFYMTASVLGLNIDSALGITLDSNVGLVEFADSSTITVTVNTTQGNITASGDIKAAGQIRANEYEIVRSDGTTEIGVIADGIDNDDLGIIFGNNSHNASYLGATIRLGTNLGESHVTASGNVSSSGDMIATTGSFNVLVSDTGSFHSLIATGDISGSATSTFFGGQAQINGNFSAASISTTSNTVTLGEASTDKIALIGIITASGNVSASGDITGSGLNIDHINIRDIDDGLYFNGTQTLFIDGDNNVNVGVDGISIVDLELYGHNHVHTAANNITLDAGGDINLDAAGDNINFKDNTTTNADLNTSTGKFTTIGDISSSVGTVYAEHLYSSDDAAVENQLTAGSVYAVVGGVTASKSRLGLRDLGHTEHTSVGTTAQGDIFYHGTTAVIPGAIYGFSSNGNVQLAQSASNNGDFTGSLFMAVDDSSGDGMLLRGMIKYHSPINANFGQALYLSDNGSCSISPPSQTNSYARIIGHVISGSGTIYFNPDNTFVKVS